MQQGQKKNSSKYFMVHGLNAKANIIRSFADHETLKNFSAATSNDIQNRKLVHKMTSY